MSSASLSALQRRFIALSSEVSSIITELDQSIPFLDNAILKIGNNYKYNDVIADDNRTLKCRNEIEKTSKHLSGTVMPAINSKISELERQIQQALRREAEEAARRAAEEAAKKAAQDVANNARSWL